MNEWKYEIQKMVLLFYSTYVNQREKMLTDAPTWQ